MDYLRRIMPGKLQRVVLMTCLTLGVTACGGGGGGGGAPPAQMPAPPPAEAQPPTASIVFPPATSISESDMVRVRGVASDNVAVAAVRVNGVAATSNNGFATWEALVPLTRGRNSLIVEAVDTNANRNPMAAQATITRTVVLRNAASLAIDSANNRALVVDLPTRSIIAVSLATGARSVFSSPTVPNTDNQLVVVSDIAIDAAAQRALVADGAQGAVIALSLSTGTRTRFLASSTSEPFTPSSLAVDAAGNRLLVLDDSRAALRVFNLATGAPVGIVLLGNADPALVQPRSVAYDTTNNRALVTAFSGAIAAVDLANGSVRLLGQDSGNLGDIEVDAANQRALIVRTTFIPATIGVLAVDLVTGARTLLAEQSTDNAFTLLGGIVVDRANNRVLSTERGNGTIVTSNLGFTSRTVLTDTTGPVSVNPLTSFAGGIARDATRNRLMVADAETKALVAIDLTDDSTVQLARSLVDRPANVFGITRIPLVFDATRNRALVLDTDAATVVAIDVGTGSRTVLSGPNPNNDDGFIAPRSIAADPARDRFFVATGTSGILFSLNPMDGSRTRISDPVRNRLGLPDGLAVDADNARVLVSDIGTILGVSLNDGVFSIVSDVVFPDGMNRLDNAKGVAIDRPRNRALVVDAGLRALVAVNLSSGARTIVSDSSTPNSRNPLLDPAGLVVDQDKAIAFIADAHRVRAVDLITGERVLL